MNLSIIDVKEREALRKVNWARRKREAYKWNTIERMEKYKQITPFQNVLVNPNLLDTFFRVPKLKYNK